MAKLGKKRLQSYFLLTIVAIIWALALPLTKKAFQSGLSPNVFLFSRFLVAAVFSLPIILLLKKTPKIKRSFKPHNLLKIILLEFIGNVLALILLYEGVKLTTAIESSLIGATWPIFVTLGGVLFLKEREEKNEYFGLTLAFAGTFLVILKPLLSTQPNGNTFGNLLILGQNFLGAIYYLLAKKNYQGINKWVITHTSFWVSTIGMALVLKIQNISALNAFIQLFHYPDPWPLISVFYMGILGSIVALTIYFLGLENIEASEAAMFSYLGPVFAIPASMFLLGETISTLEVIGFTVILIGVTQAAKR